MIVYKCVITGDEMFSDSYKVKEFEELFYEVEAKLVTEKSGDIDDSLIGGNKSAEAPDECAGTEEGSKSGPNVALANRYVETSFGSKKDFIASIGTYLKGVIKYHKERAEKDGKEFDEQAFKSQHQNAMKTTILPMFKDLQFYTGESMNPDGTMPLLFWKPDDKGDETPFFYYFKSGLNVEKY